MPFTPLHMGPGLAVKAGATLIALVSVVFGRPICQFLLRRFRPDPRSRLLNRLCSATRISWPAAISGAVVGAYSHVFFDSIMHADMHPLAPLSEANVLLHIISVENLHVVCVLSGVLAVGIMLCVYFFRPSGSGDNRA